MGLWVYSSVLVSMGFNIYDNYILSFFIFKKRHLFFIQLFGFFAYLLQYSEYNKKFYIYLSNEKK